MMLIHVRVINITLFQRFQEGQLIYLVPMEP
jgi:hypothetical protein